MKNSIIIFILMVVVLIFIGCSSTTENKTEYKPSLTEGCAGIKKVNDRLRCISRMVSTLEGIHNAEIQVSTTKQQRIDEQYISVKDTYCFVSSDKLNPEIYLCFDSFRNDYYDPTFLGQIYNWTSKIGIGFAIGLITGIYAGQ